MWGTIFALRKATVMRTKILSVTPINPLGVTAPLVNKGSRERAPSPSVRHKGAEAAPAPCKDLQLCKPQLSPPGRAALIRHGAAQRRTAPPSPRGKARAAPAAERRYCRCAYRRSFAAGGAKAVFPKGKGFSPHKFAVFVAPGRVFCYNTFNNTQNAQKGLFV